MKSLTAAVLLLLSAGSGAPSQAQSQPPPQPPAGEQSASTPDLNTILLQIQKATGSASVDLGKLRIEKWKADADQKQQSQQVSDSLQKNIANAIPGMVSAVQASRGSLLTSFKLYHNLNVVYENLIYMADVAGSLGKREEFEPLAADITALESARKELSLYIEQAAVRIESANRQMSGTIPMPARPGQGAAVPGKKVVIDDEDSPPPKKPTKPTKKKTSPAPTPSPAQSAGSPH
jgi:hypothetical protein